MRYGSDVIIDWLVEAGIEYVVLNPGATIRGLHDSLVHCDKLTTVLVTHEEIAVGMAHGYWKATGKHMAVFVHDLVGLQHASMALFNASIDQVPMLVVGGSGPQDETRRRPWLDWIHTSVSHTTMIRDVVKRTFEPASLMGVRDSLARALSVMESKPGGPVYLVVDVAVQEDLVDEEAVGALPRIAPVVARPSAEDVALLTERLAGATRPVLVVDRPVPGALDAVVRVAEATGAAVVDLGGGFGYPSTHWTNQSEHREAVLSDADVVVALDVRDIRWATGTVDERTRERRSFLPETVALFSVGCNELRDMSFVVPDALVPGTSYVVADTALVVRDLAARLDQGATPSVDPERRAVLARQHAEGRAALLREVEVRRTASPVDPMVLSAMVHRAVADGPWVLANGLVKGWTWRLWEFSDRGTFLGRSGGEGLGYGLPASLGAALAHAGPHEDEEGEHAPVVVNIQADGDLLYTSSALWTAASSNLPLLMVVHNNGTYGKDELHQAEIGATRGRAGDRTHVGIRIDQPRVDFAMLARAQGVEALGPISTPAELETALAHAVRVVRHERRPILLDVICSS